MSQSKRPRSLNSSAAFTLIELLVVVAIIALLISILLPSLADARQQAKRLVCGSNLRQIGIGLATCGAENKGCYPTIDDGVGSCLYSWIDTLYDLDYIGNIELQQCPTDLKQDPAMLQRGEAWGFQYLLRFGQGERPRVGVRTSYAINTIAASSWPQDRQADASRQVAVAGGFWNWFGNMSPHWSMAPFIAGTTLPFDGTYASWQGAMIGFRHGRSLGANMLFFDGHVKVVAPRKPRSFQEYADYVPGRKKMVDTSQYFTWLPGESTRRLDVYNYGFDGEITRWADRRPQINDPTTSFPGWYRNATAWNAPEICRLTGSWVPNYYPRELGTKWRTAEEVWRKLPARPEDRH